MKTNAKWFSLYSVLFLVMLLLLLFLEIERRNIDRKTHVINECSHFVHFPFLRILFFIIPSFVSMSHLFFCSFLCFSFIFAKRNKRNPHKANKRKNRDFSLLFRQFFCVAVRRRNKKLHKKYDATEKNNIYYLWLHFVTDCSRKVRRIERTKENSWWKKEQMWKTNCKSKRREKIKENRTKYLFFSFHSLFVTMTWENLKSKTHFVPKS